jgi:hypothetical protein
MFMQIDLSVVCCIATYRPASETTRLERCTCCSTPHTGTRRGRPCPRCSPAAKWSRRRRSCWARESVFEKKRFQDFPTATYLVLSLLMSLSMIGTPL